MQKITASHLYNFIQCPHRVWRDAHDNKSLADEPNEFVQMLWEKGTQYEREVIDAMAGSEVILDLAVVSVEGRAERTLAAMESKAEWIYHGRLEVDNLLGEPDLLRLLPDGQYVAVDVKSGTGLEGASEFEEGKLKKHYALQLALYTDALRRLGFAQHYLGKILDVNGEFIDYNLDESRGKRAKETWWEFYQEALMVTGNILNSKIETKPALGSVCKLCIWYSDCKKQCVDSGSLSLIPELGRSRQEALEELADNVQDFAALDPDEHVDAKGKVDIKGIGKATLLKFHQRAELLVESPKQPMITGAIVLPDKPIELYFDIEADPTRDLVYLHGVVERRMADPDNLKFHAFVADDVTKVAEEKAWAEFWDYIRSLPESQYAAYYYSSYEKTQYKALQKKYPDVVSMDEVEVFFDCPDTIDLYYDVVKKCTEWPTYNYSIKSLAQFLGFSWRDPNPSGAASIQWFNEWVKDRSAAKLQRILDYNEDDCIATIVLKDALVKYAD